MRRVVILTGFIQFQTDGTVRTAAMTLTAT